MLKKIGTKDESTYDPCPKKKKKANSPGILSQFLSWSINLRHNPESAARARKILAWTLLFLGVLSFIACISHFYHGRSDQSITEGGAGSGQVHNVLGFAGAWVAHWLVTRGFGVFGLIIPAYTVLMGLVLLEDDFYTIARRLVKYALFMLLWGSLFISYIVILTQSENYDLGGGFGYHVNQWLFGYVGKVGVAFLMLFAVVLFIVVNFNAEVRASRLIARLSEVKENVVQQAKANRPQAAKPKKAKDSVKSRIDALRKKKTAEEDNSNGLDLNEEENDSKPILKEPETPAQVGEQISFDVVESRSLSPASKPKAKHKVENEDLELIIEEPVNEKQQADHEKKEFVQLGEDNVGLVKGAEGKVEKIVEKESQEIDLEEFEAYDPTKELSSYEMPPIPLLEDHGTGQDREVDRTELVGNKNKIVETLKNYGIEITSIKATVGPTVTLYEIVPAPGVRISKIRNLEDDIALSLAALGIRIIAPIPGKGTIGIEVPNSKAEIVSLRGVLSTEKFKDTKAELPIALGRNISNKVVVQDLNKMPHLLIAGATGQGKSVGLNTVIASILYKRHPAEVKFVLIDPKKVEMSLYQSLQYHYIAMMPNQKNPIITDVREAVNVLKALGVEMDQRYSLLQMARVRNLKEYNKKFLARKLNPRKGHYFMPYIVLVIDELADMMMVAGKEVELPIARLAQLARAVGIHLVVATQRPSVNVITGIIKANFPARMSYRVISKVDSRTILDANGADQLIGRGDMLLSTGSDLTRIQNAFIDTPEVERLVDFISEQRGFPEPYYLPELPGEDDEGGIDNEPFEKDSMFEDAARLVVKFQMGSASLIQRKMKLGYNRAGRIVDQLERAGIVGPHSGSKARDVLITDEAELERYLSNI